MVEQQIRARGISKPDVLEAVKSVPRELFVPEHLEHEAFADRPLPIGEGQTISQPYIVALMTEAVYRRGTDKILEIGTGCGYQTAILAELFDQVYSIEVYESLQEKARQVLDRLRYHNVSLKVGDGFEGWPEHGPYDAIILTAAPAGVPRPLLDQLAEEGRLIAPVGTSIQDLMLFTRRGGQFVEKRLGAVRFVPMTGRARAGD
jgi:protein-L-isoaspartate(D-aspartate) O-methyltransferase